MPEEQGGKIYLAENVHLIKRKIPVLMIMHLFFFIFIVFYSTYREFCFACFQLKKFNDGCLNFVNK